MSNRTIALSDTGIGAGTGARATLVPQAMLAIFFGALLIYGVGLAQPSALHAAAHDTRHSAAFPCH
jgi:cobalt transporter subunit CbtB